MMDVREFQNIFPEFEIEKEKNIINWETYAYAFTLKLSPWTCLGLESGYDLKNKW